MIAAYANQSATCIILCMNIESHAPSETDDWWYLPKSQFDPTRYMSLKPGLIPLSDMVSKAIAQYPDENLVVRTEEHRRSPYYYGSPEEVMLEANRFRDFLSWIRKGYDIRTLDPQFFVGNIDDDGDTSSKFALHAVVPKIAEYSTFHDLVKSQSAALGTYMVLLQKLSNALGDICESGGMVYPDVFRLDQFVLPADDVDNDLVLVDIMPEHGENLPSVYREGTYGIASHVVVDSVLWLCEDAMTLADGLNSNEPIRVVEELLNNKQVSRWLGEEVYRNFLEALKNGDKKLFYAHEN